MADWTDRLTEIREEWSKATSGYFALPAAGVLLESYLNAPSPSKQGNT